VNAIPTLRSSVLKVVAMLSIMVALMQPVEAQEVLVPSNIQLALVDKILSFDRAVSRSGDQVIVIGIVYQKEYRKSVTEKDDLLKASEAGGRGRIQMIPIEVNGSGDNLQSSVPDEVTVLYVMPLRWFNLDIITSLSRSRRILTVTGVSEYVHAGVALGFSVKDERPQILINLRAARAEGADFSSKLLNIAKVIQ